MKSALTLKVEEDLSKALGHLEYSFNKAQKILKKTQLSEEDLESLEGFGSRFARASDIGIQKLLRLKVMEKDPAFRGGVIDVLNQAEKFGWIASATEWARIRELRNVTAHEYSEAEARVLYSEILKRAETVLLLKTMIGS